MSEAERKRNLITHLWEQAQLMADARSKFMKKKFKVIENKKALGMPQIVSAFGRRHRNRSRSRSRSKHVRKSRRRSGRRGNPQAAQAMRLMRSEGISLKAAWAQVKGGKGMKTSKKRRSRQRRRRSRR